MAEQSSMDSRREDFIEHLTGVLPRTVTAKQVEDVEDLITDHANEVENAASAWDGPRSWPKAHVTTQAILEALGVTVEAKPCWCKDPHTIVSPSHDCTKWATS